MKKKIIAAILALSLMGSQIAHATEDTVPTETAEPVETTMPATQPAETAPQATEVPTQPTIAAPPPTEPVTEPSMPIMPTALEIDTGHVYPGMDKAYEDGYVPKVNDGNVYLVLPLISSGEIHNGEIKASLDLGGSSSPFAIANYEKTVKLESIVPEGSQEEVAVYLVAFEVPLAKARTNGVYPVTVKIAGYAASGAAVDCMYTLYVTITDGKSNEPTQPYVETPTAEPVVYIAKTQCLQEKIIAGETFTLTLTLKNSLDTKSIHNMMVKVDTGNLQIELMEDTNIFPIEKIDAGGQALLTLRFTSDISIPAGKYTLNFQFTYDSNKTLNLSSSGTTTVEIGQPANMELVMPRFPDSVTVGETIPLSLQVLNMGRDGMYNVRCILSGAGFSPSNTGYIGTMAAGSSATTDMELYIIALNLGSGNENSSQYGDTTGTVTLIYENASGEEFRQEATFSTTVNRPVMSVAPAADSEAEAEKTAHSWWTSILIMGGVIVASILIALILGSKKRKGGAYL